MFLVGTAKVYTHVRCLASKKVHFLYFSLIFFERDCQKFIHEGVKREFGKLLQIDDKLFARTFQKINTKYHILA